MPYIFKWYLTGSKYDERRYPKKREREREKTVHHGLKI